MFNFQYQSLKPSLWAIEKIGPTQYHNVCKDDSHIIELQFVRISSNIYIPLFNFEPLLMPKNCSCFTVQTAIYENTPYHSACIIISSIKTF